MSDLNEFGPLGRKSSGITLPSSFVRPVSLDRVRGISASKKDIQTSADKEFTENNGSLSNRSHQQYHHKQTACQKLLNKKLFGISNKSLKSIVSTSRTEQLHREHGIREEKRVERLREHKDDELKECSFKPKTLVQNLEKRSLQQFLDQQANHSKKTAHKLEIIRDQLNKEKVKDATFQPRINKFNHKEIENKENVHTRLYELSKSKDGMSREEVNQSGMSSREQSRKKLEKVSESPKGNQKKMVKNTSISNLNTLTHKPSVKTIPTIPRIPSTKSIERSKTNSLPSNVPAPQTISQNTQKQLVRKIVRELCSAAESLGIGSSMSYLELSNLLVAMRFISEDNVERRSLYDLWTVLNGHLTQQVDAYNLCRVLCSVMGLHNQQIVQKEIQLSQQPLLNRSSELNNEFDEQVSTSSQLIKPDFLHMTEKESKDLKKHLEPLYINRLNIDHSRQVSVEQHSFKPVISEVSKELAEKKRTKVLEETMELLKNNEIEYQIQESGEISHADYLVLQKKVQELKLNKMIEQKQAMEQEKIEQMTRTQHPPSSHSSHGISSQRHLDLYAMGAFNKEKRDRTADEVELERFKKQMTFKPDISKTANDKFQPVAKDIDKAIYRMYQGRKMRDSEPAESLNAKKKTPLLYLNINIDNRTTERLEIFEGDNPLELAAKFAQRFGLNPEAKRRLSELIVSELKQLI